jgi:hypothetical protein
VGYCRPGSWQVQWAMGKTGKEPLVRTKPVSWFSSFACEYGRASIQSEALPAGAALLGSAVGRRARGAPSFAS